MNHKHASLIVFTALLILLPIGCATAPDGPPSKMGRVKVLPYDSVSRAMTPSLEIFSKSPEKPHKIIALITCEGAYHEEVIMMKAIHYKARQLGADGVIQLNHFAATTGSGSMYGGQVGGRSLFRAEAFVYDK